MMSWDELCCYGTYCLICGEEVVMLHKNDAPKICDKCKSAVMKMREEMESSEDKE